MVVNKYNLKIFEHKFIIDDYDFDRYHSYQLGFCDLISDHFIF